MLTSPRTRLATAALAVAAVAVLAVPGTAAAHTEGDGPSFHHRRHHHHRLSDAQKACLAGQGVTFPLTSVKHGDPAAWMRFVAALQTCGILPTRPTPPASVTPAARVTPPPTAAAPTQHWSTPAAPGSSFGQWHSWRDADHHDGGDHDFGGWHRGGQSGGWGHRSGGFGD